MAQPMPFPLSRLLEAADPPAREQAWADLIASHTRLLMKVAATPGGGYDATMDRFAYILEKLKDQDYRRLRSYEPRQAQFSTWLVVVARRLCTDYKRERYGRFRKADAEERSARRSLADLVTAAPLDTERLPATDDVEEAAISAERSRALEAALSQLLPDDRLLLRLRYDDEVPVKEIRGILGLPTVFHVYRRLNAAHEQLRVHLARHGLTTALD